MKNKIKEVLREKGISQKKLCEMVNMSEAGMSNAINGSATKPTLEKIAEALDVSYTDLLDEEVRYAKFGSDKTPLRFGALEIPCYVLDDGTRVFSGRGMQKAIGYESKSGQWINSFANMDGLSNYLSAGQNNILMMLQNPIQFKRNNAGGSQSTTNGYEATLLVDICAAIIDANRAGDFNDERIVFNADIIIRSVAKVGIIALVDEATGYDKEKTRAKNELQKFLAEFINKEAGVWVKTFDDTFFEDIYKMRNWTWAKTTARPSFVGKIINDIVYERIAPLVYEELRRLNPKGNTGNRKFKHHQFLTSDMGKPTLQKHLAVLHSFAVASDYNWGRFMYLLDKAHPKMYQQLTLFDDFE